MQTVFGSGVVKIQVALALFCMSYNCIQSLQNPLDYFSGKKTVIAVMYSLKNIYFYKFNLCLNLSWHQPVLILFTRELGPRE